jgi:pSer/pThr/pTyr-binding forkhead associated (FHA) protein
MDGDDSRIDWDDDEITSESMVERRTTTSLRRARVLRQVAGPGAPREFVLAGAALLAGRAAEADIRVISSSVSRHHMRLECDGPEITCRDLGSRNGVFLNGLKVHSAVLRPGDQIQIGAALFVFVDAASSPTDPV